MINGLLRFVDGFHIATAQMCIHAHTVAHQAAEQIIDRLIEHFAADIPQRLLDARDGRHPDHTHTPEGLAVHLLVQEFDARRIVANQHWGKIFHRTDDAARLPLQRRLAPAVKPLLIGLDLNKDPVAHFRIDNDSFDGSDFHNSVRLCGIGGWRLDT